MRKFDVRWWVDFDVVTWRMMMACGAEYVPLWRYEREIQNAKEIAKADPKMKVILQ